MEWIQKSKSHLVVIAISNTMDYAEKLPPKLQSRFGKSSVTFRQYSIEQLKEIVSSRLKEIQVFT
jgi:origin recognition complex subunit 1